MVATERVEARDGRRTWRCCSFESHSWLGGLCVARFECPTRRPTRAAPPKCEQIANRHSHRARFESPAAHHSAPTSSSPSSQTQGFAPIVHAIHSGRESVVNKYNYIGARRKANHLPISCSASSMLGMPLRIW